jgi:hypothetical protein
MICYIGKPAYLSMPKFLAGCHYNEEEISWHLKQYIIGYWPVQINGNKCATGQILENLVEVVKARISAGGAQKPPEPWLKIDKMDRHKCRLLEEGILVNVGKKPKQSRSLVKHYSLI